MTSWKTREMKTLSNEIIKYIVEGIIALVLILVSRYLIPLIKNKIGDDQFTKLAGWVKFAVLKAEQVLTAETGEQKKEYVISFIDEVLAENKINVTAEQLDVLIESAVKEMNIAQNKIKKIETATVTEESK